jgi:hypothetical protein
VHRIAASQPSEQTAPVPTSDEQQHGEGHPRVPAALTDAMSRCRRDDDCHAGGRGFESCRSYYEPSHFRLSNASDQPK